MLLFEYVFRMRLFKLILGRRYGYFFFVDVSVNKKVLIIILVCVFVFRVL